MMRTAEERRADAEKRITQRLAEKKAREPKKKRKKRKRGIRTITLMIPVKLHRQLKRKAKEVGCSMASLIKNYIHAGLEGVVYTESYRQIRTIQQEKEFTIKAKKAPANYAQPAYFAELKRAIAIRKKRKDSTIS